MIKRLRPIGLILLVAIVLSPLLRELVRDIIVIPILYLFWIGRFILEAIPQLGLWGCFLIVVTLILGAGFLGRRRASLQAMPSPPAYEGRVESWANLVKRAEQDDYYKWRLAQRLQKLTLQAIANDKSQTVKETRQQLRRGELDMPEAVAAYFQASLQPLGYLPSRKRLFGSNTSPSPLNTDPRQIIRYLQELGGETDQQLNLEAE
ncbi:MAG: hypothetical protein OES12_03055 [Anaerolineae bacterium]|jgi:hypothetical protein|nr:hypothetical protein [Anaerolineae bacterium]